MIGVQDGPRTALFHPLTFQGNVALSDLAGAGLSPEMAAALEHAPAGECTGWGIPFQVEDVIVLKERPIAIELPPVTAQWLVFMHTSDLRPFEPGPDGFFSPMRGQGQLGEHAADYVVLYEDGTEERAPIRRRLQIGAFQRRWGENSFEAVAHNKPFPVRASHEQASADWGRSQTRAMPADARAVGELALGLGESAPGEGHRRRPLRAGVGRGDRVWHLGGRRVGAAPALAPRRKACLTLPRGEAFQPELDEHGLLQQIQLDMGQVISATPRLVYPNDAWADDLQQPDPGDRLRARC